MHGKHLHGVPDPGDRHERSRVVPDVLVDQRSDEKIAGAAQQNRVAIGFSGDHRFRPDRAAGAAGSIIHDHRLSEVGRHFV